jgi:hypothetical protein
MATKFSSVIWPPLAFPKGVTVGGTYKLSPMPNGFVLNLPANPVAGGVYPLAPAPKEGPRLSPVSPVSSVNYTPVPPPAIVTTYVDPNITRNNTLNFFSIISPQPGSGT